MAYAPVNLRSYELMFARIKGKTKKYMLDVMKKTVESCMDDIINHEPAPYKTGSYIASHRVGINAIDTSDTVFKDVGDCSLGDARSIARKEKEKIKEAKIGDTIYISNSVGSSTKYGYVWAGNVEYQGWNGKGPYLVYEKAALNALNNISKHAIALKTTHGALL